MARAEDGPTGDPSGRPWWADAVIYQIYPRSFADADGDGIGDLPGIRARLGHIARLGVDAVWLSPFYPSPLADGGYDVVDHCGVDPRLGTLADAEALVAEAHALGIRVLVDLIPNHTSDRHPWFVASRSSRHDPRRGWYYWADPVPEGGPPNNWRASFTGETTWARDADGQLRPRRGQAPAPGTEADASAWTWDEGTGQWYLHTFLPSQPDLDWHHPDVVAAQHDVVRFWSDRGVDGFRVDAVITLGKPAGLPDAAPELAALPEAGLTDEAFTQARVAELRAVVEGYPGDRVLVGEVGGVDEGAIRRYVSDHLFHLAFDFPPLFEPWDAEAWRAQVDEAERHVDPTGARRTAWVLSNHDQPRHADRYGTQARARAAAVLLLGLPGPAFVYAGEELGLVDAEVGPHERIDPGGRDGSRAPIPWTPSPDHGWGSPTWLPFPRNAAGHDVETQDADPGSVLWLYRRLLAARRATPALRHGPMRWAEAPAGVLAWHRVPPDGDGEERLVAVSFVDEPRAVPLSGPRWVLEVSSQGDGTEAGRPWDGHLAPDEAVIARPAD